MRVHHHIEDWITHVSYKFILYNENIIGNCILQIEDGVYSLHGMYILPEYRGLDYGIKLIDEVKKYVIDDVYIIVNLSYDRLIKWYESQEFIYHSEYDNDYGWWIFKK